MYTGIAEAKVGVTIQYLHQGYCDKQSITYLHSSRGNLGDFTFRFTTRDVREESEFT